MNKTTSPIPTPHIQAKEGEIAKTVLMPGDPLRAKFIAETFLEDIVCFNKVRGMLGFTGLYKGEKISVMGSGMGMASIGIYSYELFKFYDVDNIIRVGSCGSYSKDLSIYDVVLCKSAFSESTYAKSQHGYGDKFIYPSKKLNLLIQDKAKELNIELFTEKIHSSDVFYKEAVYAAKLMEKIVELDVKAVEMESFALFANAKITGKNAASVLTVSDSFISGEVTTAQERQEAFDKMMILSLESGICL